MVASPVWKRTGSPHPVSASSETVDTVTIEIRHSSNRTVDEWCDKVAAHIKTAGCVDVTIEQAGDGAGVVSATVPDGVDSETVFDGFETPPGMTKLTERT